MSEIAIPDSRVTPLTGSIGAQVDVPEVAQLRGEHVAVINKALSQYGAVFLRHHSTDPGDLESFAAMFGDVLPGHPLKPGLEGHPAILANETGNIDPEQMRCRDPFNRNRTNWHVDCTFLEAIPRLSFLQAAVVPQAGGDTLFADMAGAYETLAPPLQRLVDELECVHNVALQYPDWVGPDAPEAMRSKMAALPPVRRPLTTVDPLSGRTALLLNPNVVSGIEGLCQLESDAILSLLMHHALVPERTVRWRWQPGDIAIWSNTRLLHNFVIDHGGSRRLIYRAITK